MPSYNILLIPGERKWTSKALHLACAIAQSNEGQVTLLKMVPVSHPALLGSPEGSRHVTDDELRALTDLATTAQKYGAPITVTLCQYASYTRALISAAEQLDAAAVFAAPSTSRIPLWARIQDWRLESSLSRLGCTWHTVEPSGGPLEWTPSATQATSTVPLSRRKESQA